MDPIKGIFVMGFVDSEYKLHNLDTFYGGFQKVLKRVAISRTGREMITYRDKMNENLALKMPVINAELDRAVRDIGGCVSEDDPPVLFEASSRLSGQNLFPFSSSSAVYGDAKESNVDEKEKSFAQVASDLDFFLMFKDLTPQVLESAGKILTSRGFSFVGIRGRLSEDAPAEKRNLAIHYVYSKIIEGIEVELKIRLWNPNMVHLHWFAMLQPTKLKEQITYVKWRAKSTGDPCIYAAVKNLIHNMLIWRLKKKGVALDYL